MNKKELLIRIKVFVFFLLFIFAFLGLTGTLSSGFHFVDNHEVVQINKDVSNMNGDIFLVIHNWVKGDLQGRFRPLYIIDNVVVFSLFKGNFFWLSVYHSVIIVLIAFFLFLAIRKFGASLLNSLLLPTITLIGIQSAIWWRLGPNETIGMLYLSLTLLFMSYVLKTKKVNSNYKILFAITGLLMMFCKESFLLLTPALLISYVGVVFLTDESQNLWKILVKNATIIILFSSVFIVSIIFILLKVNTESLGYAGIKDVHFNMYIDTFNKLLMEGGVGITSLILFIISIFAKRIICKSKIKDFYAHFFVLIVTVFIILPQVYLYGKSGIFERYYLPGMLGWAVLLTYSLEDLKNTIINLESRKASISFYVFEVALILLIVTPKLLSELNEANTFTNDGKVDNSILSIVESNVSSSDTLLFIADPVTDCERTFSFKRYFNSKSNINNLYTCPVACPAPDSYQRMLIDGFTGLFGGEERKFDKIINTNNVKAVLAFPYWAAKSDSILNKIGYNLNNYTVYTIGEYKLYLHKESNVSVFTYKYTANSLTAFSNNIYNETSFYPSKSINAGDSVEIQLTPESTIQNPMKAFIILLDADHPENILIHNQISCISDLIQKRIVSTNITRPWVIYRNWGKESSIPAADILVNIKRTNKIIIPVR